MNSNGRNCCNYGNSEKKKMSPSDRNCCNFGISEKRIVHGYSNCVIMTILEMIKLIFDAHICCNYGNSKNNI